NEVKFEGLQKDY
ncbi:MAG: hypothetical protein EZS28_050667, partial [Streblomastix strix]